MSLCFPSNRCVATRASRYALIFLGLAFPFTLGFAQVGRGSTDPSAALCSAAWTNPGAYDRGASPTVSLAQNGFFIEEHGGENNSNKLYYKLGRFVDGVPKFGPPVQYDLGFNPTVAVNSKGIVVDVHEGASSTQLLYRVGHVNIDGDINTELVVWDSGSNAIRFDNGHDPSIGMNDDGVIAIVWRTDNVIYTSRLYSMYGLVGPNAPASRIHWESGAKLQFELGFAPHIAIDSQNEVIEVHQGADAKNLHYRRGFVNLRYSQMGWVGAAGNSRYVTGNSTVPAVALSPRGGNVIETHSTSSNEGKYMIGQLDPRDNGRTDWSGVNSFKPNMWTSSLTTNGEYALEVNKKSYDPYLEYSYTRLSCP
jgi:hypothetical protein